MIGYKITYFYGSYRWGLGYLYPLVEKGNSVSKKFIEDNYPKDIIHNRQGSIRKTYRSAIGWNESQSNISLFVGLEKWTIEILPIL